MEIFTSPKKADKMLQLAQDFNIEAKVIGRVEASAKKELLLRGSFGEIKY